MNYTKQRVHKAANLGDMACMHSKHCHFSLIKEEFGLEITAGVELE